MFGENVLLFILFWAAVFLSGILISWLVIYSAVRAALSAHRQAMARGGRPGQV
ncbi:MAG: hypothetical protein U1E32_00470 [Rhodoglobus sp.]|nr:hypothetical protein [Rhodoglobus sp.]